ncbi:MAG: hypothetical protein EOO62_06840 [Hymenobacter sp.]|nr:MAG: hypothetical protein EOO62_06840 [Hymenobacter sp.]
MTVQRAIDPSQNAGLGYRHFSPPVNYTTVADLATTASGGSFAPVLNPAYNSAAAPANVTPFPMVFKYDNNLLSQNNNLSLFDKGWVSPISPTDLLIAGNGIIANIGAGEVVDFQGTLNTGDFVVSIPAAAPPMPMAAGGSWANRTRRRSTCRSLPTSSTTWITPCTPTAAPAPTWASTAATSTALATRPWPWGRPFLPA